MARHGVFDGLGAVFRHEWRMLAHHATTPVLLGGLSTCLALAVFLVGDFYATDHATADLLWTFLPWAAVVFVPALAIGAFAERTGDRSLELTLTLPVSDLVVAVGKWAAGTAMLLVSLIGTLPFVLTLAYLGAPDFGALAGGYLGAGLLLSAFFAIALTGSALVRDSVGGCLVGILALLALLIVASDAVVRPLAGSVFAGPIGVVALWSPKLWLDRLASGRIELAAFAVTASIVALSLAAIVWSLGRRRRGGVSVGDRLRAAATAVGLALAAAALTAISAQAPLLADLTEGRLHTLHKETRQIARTVPDGTRVDLYWSATEGRVPAAIRAHAARTRALLATIAAQSNGRLVVAEHDPQPDSDAETAALGAGIRRVQMTSGDRFFLGVTVRHGERLGTLPHLDVARDAALEYDLALTLSGLTRTRTPKLGILSPLLAPRHVSEPREGLSFLDDLKRAFDVAIIPHFADRLPDGLDTLLVINAPILKRDMLYAIDQHAVAGKGLIVLLDPYARFDNAVDIAIARPSESIDDVSDLLLRYGLRFEPDKVIGDVGHAATVTGQDGRKLAYPLWPQIVHDGLNADHRATATATLLQLAEPGAFTIEPGRDSAVRFLARTGSQSVEIGREAIATRTAEALTASLVPDGRERIVAAAVEAGIASAFEAAPTGFNPAAHRSTSGPWSRVFAVADSDFLFDPMALTVVEAGDRRITRPLNDNIAFMFNLAELASGDPRLLAVRSRGGVNRPFTRVAALVAEAQRRYQNEEARLLGAIGRVEDDIAKVLQISGAKSIDELPTGIQARIRDLLVGLAPYRRELRAIRLAMRQQVEQLGLQLTAANLLAPSGLAVMFALVAVGLRRARRRSTRPVVTRSDDVARR